MTSIILYGVLAIAIAIAFAGLFRQINAPKVEKEKTAQEVEDTKQTTVHDETREDIVKARLSVRRERRWWKIFGRPEAAPPLPVLDPKPNRPL